MLIRVEQIVTAAFSGYNVAVARYSSGGVAIRCVLPVLWMTSRLAVMGRMAMRGDAGAESDVYECLVENWEVRHVVCHVDLALAALSLQASRHLSGVSGCSIHEIASRVVREEWMQVGKGNCYNRASAANASAISYNNEK